MRAGFDGLSLLVQSPRARGWRRRANGRSRFDLKCAPVEIRQYTLPVLPWRARCRKSSLSFRRIRARPGCLSPLSRAASASAPSLAFTNYLATSIICTLIFNGSGFGLFGQLARVQMYLVVAAVWTVQLAWSRPWLNHFRFGPFEWVWRSLTYWKRQPMRVTPAAAQAAAAGTEILRGSTAAPTSEPALLRTSQNDLSLS
jgi:hypothetical protein